MVVSTANEFMKQIILHIGGPKCGSTAVQKFLTYNNHLKTAAGVNYIYCCIQNDGSVIHGASMGDAIRRLDPIALSSMHIHWHENDGAKFKKGLRKVMSLADETHIPILSCEAWGEWHSCFADHGVFDDLQDVQIKILLFVRPQVSWFNSAWWQWGAWSDCSVDDWMQKVGVMTCDWNGIASSWEALPNVNQVRVYDVGANVIDSLLDFLGVVAPKDTDKNVMANSATPRALLEFFQRNRGFRAGPHDVGREWVLKQRVKFHGLREPFILTEEQQEFIRRTFGHGNRELARFFASPAEWQRFMDSPQWIPREVSKEETGETTSQADIDVLIGDLIRTICDLSEKMVEARYENHAIKHELLTLKNAYETLQCLSKQTTIFQPLEEDDQHDREPSERVFGR